MAEIQGLQTRGDIATSVAQFIGDESLSLRRKILASLDRNYRTALRRYRWPNLIRWVDAGLTVSAGTAYVFAPKNLRGIIGFVDTMNPFNVTEWSTVPFIEFTRGMGFITGQPTRITFIGTYGINTILLGLNLEIASNGADTRTVIVRGRLNNEDRSISATLNGTTTVSVGIFDEITSFSVVAGPVQRPVIIRAGSGGQVFDPLNPGTVLGAIALNDIDAVYRKFEITPTPANAATIRLVYYATPPPIIDENHPYDIPIHEWLFEKAVVEVLESRRQYAPASEHRTQAEEAWQIAVNEIESTRIHVAIPMTERGPRAYGIVVQTVD